MSNSTEKLINGQFKVRREIILVIPHILKFSIDLFFVLPNCENLNKKNMKDDTSRIKINVFLVQWFQN